MRNRRNPLVDVDFQSLQRMGWQVPGPDESIPNLLKIISHDIRVPLVSILATLKLLNRGYYGKMDEEVAKKLKGLLPRLIDVIAVTDAFDVATKENH
jgi:signal transduction histidine kinase